MTRHGDLKARSRPVLSHRDHDVQGDGASENRTEYQ